MSNQLQTIGWIEDGWDRFKELIPSAVNLTRFKRNLIHQVRTNETIAKCSPMSILESCIQASNLGLDIGVLGSCHLLPYKGRCTLVIGYQGLLALAKRSGQVRAVYTGLVRERDEFHRDATSFTHNYNPFASRAERGEYVGAYAIIELKDGGRQIETMSVEEIERIRDGRAGPWNDYWGEMAKKTVLRRALKLVDLSPELSETLAGVDRAEWDAPVAAQPAPLAIGAPSGPPTAAETLAALQGAPAAPQDEGEEAAEEPAGKSRSPKQPWSDFLERFRALCRHFEVGEWRTISPQRAKLLERRMAEEGMADREEFVEVLESICRRSDPGYMDGWSSASLDLLIRVPTRGNADHFRLLAEIRAPEATPPKDEEKAPTLSDQILGLESA